MEEEKRAMWIFCPTCDKEKCERDADDCDVKRILMKKKAIKSVVTESEEAWAKIMKFLTN